MVCWQVKRKVCKKGRKVGRFVSIKKDSLTSWTSKLSKNFAKIGFEKNKTDLVNSNKLNQFYTASV